MRIEESLVTMSATHSYLQEIETSTSFRRTLRGAVHSGNASTEGLEDREIRVLAMLEKLMARMLDYLSGAGNAQVTDLREVLRTDDVALTDKGAQTSRRSDMRWQSETIERLHEHEDTQFVSTGKIRTSDGRALGFNLELDMCRDFASERKNSQSGSVELCDPLVINFEGKALELSGKRFAFDLDVDGETEVIQGFGGSGYLSIDRNGDGCINDGSELFGTRSGNGFADLASFDDDGNNWLDESDEIFNTLRVWQPDAAEKEMLVSLRQKGVGAIYLGSTETPFALTDAENRLLANIRSSGVYLREDGRSGSVQQVDLAV